MGTVNFGFPLEIAGFLKETLGIEIFIEGGTYKGNSAIQASKIFGNVVTIEKSQPLFEEAEKKTSRF